MKERVERKATFTSCTSNTSRREKTSVDFQPSSSLFTPFSRSKHLAFSFVHSFLPFIQSALRLILPSLSPQSMSLIIHPPGEHASVTGSAGTEPRSIGRISPGALSIFAPPSAPLLLLPPPHRRRSRCLVDPRFTLQCRSDIWSNC